MNVNSELESTIHRESTHRESNVGLESQQIFDEKRKIVLIMYICNHSAVTMILHIVYLTVHYSALSCCNVTYFILSCIMICCLHLLHQNCFNYNIWRIYHSHCVYHSNCHRDIFNQIFVWEIISNHINIWLNMSRRQFEWYTQCEWYILQLL